MAKSRRPKFRRSPILGFEICPFAAFNPPVHFKRITLAGVGLLGGSLGLAVRERGLAGEVVGLVRRPESVTECAELDVADSATLDAEEAARGSDLIVHCAPVSQMKGMQEAMNPGLSPGAIVTDVGSVKAAVTADLEGPVVDAGGVFIGSHPMAGGEKTGVANARAGLFEGATVVVTRPGDASTEAFGRIVAFWKALGAEILEATPERHDRLVGLSSHLPHVAAAALARVVLGADDPGTGRVCGAGFRDTTRIASGSAAMWRDIVLSNPENVTEAIDRMVSDLTALKEGVRAGDAEAVERYFREAKQIRDRWAGN